MPRQIDYAALAREMGGVAVDGGPSSDRAPEPDYAAMARQHGAVGILEPMAPAVSHVRPGDQPPQTIGRFAGESTQSINPVNIARGISETVRHPVNTVTGTLDAHDAMRRQALEAFEQGDYLASARHLLGYALPVAAGVGGAALGLPGGPAGVAAGAAGGYGLGVGLASRLDEASTRLQAGDVAGGLGATVDAATMGVLGARGALPAQRTVATARPPLLRRGAEAVIRPTLTPEEASAVAFAREQRVPLDLGTQTGRQSVKNLQKAVGPYGPSEAFRASQEANLSRVGGELAAVAGPRSVSPVAAGEGVRGALQSRVKQFHERANDAYARLRNAATAAPVDMVQARPRTPINTKAVPDLTPERSFVLRWMAKDLTENQFQQGGTTLGTRRRAYESLDPVEAEALHRNPRVAGTPLQQTFHVLGLKGTRAELATRIDRFLTGKSKDTQLLKLADAYAEAFDGQRWDFDLVSDDTLAGLGLRRRDLKEIASLPDFDEAGAATFFPDDAILAAPVRATSDAAGDTPMRLAVDLRGHKEALRPLLDDLIAEREVTGNLMGAKGRAAVALEALLSGPDYAPLTTVDQALGPLKQLTRGASMPQLRNRGQGIASKVVGELDAAVRERAQAAGPDVAQALSEGRTATRQKYATAAVMKRLTGKEGQFEPRRIFNALTARNDGGVEALRALQREAPDALPDIGRAYLEEALTRAETAGGLLEHSKALWSHWQKLGPETRARLFPKEGQIKALNDYFTLVHKMGENPNPSGTASVMQASLSPRKTIPRAILARILYAPDGPQRLGRVELMLKSPSKGARAAAVAQLAKALETAGQSSEMLPPLAADAETRRR